MSGAKNSGFAYLLALTGGVFGIHHLYLGRTQHALLWLTTFGGFGLGIIDEIFYRLGEYVREENHDEMIIQQYQSKTREQKSPAFELKRFLGQYFIAIFYGFVTYYAFPDNWYQNIFLSLFIGICTAFAVAVGIYLTGTIGPRQCSFIWPLLGAILALPWLMGSQDRAPSLSIAALVSSWILEWKIDWNPEYFPTKSELKKTPKQRTRLLKRSLILVAGGLVFGLILTSAIYQNFQVNINGERVKIKDVLGDFIRSQRYVQSYQRLSIVVKEIYAFYRQYGFNGSWTHVWEALNSQNDEQAFEILDLDSDASQEEIEIQCRILPRKWHPDRYRLPEDKRKAEEMFMNIQEACNRLSDERRRRQTLNTQKRENPI